MTPVGPREVASDALALGMAAYCEYRALTDDNAGWLLVGLVFAWLGSLDAVRAFLAPRRGVRTAAAGRCGPAREPRYSHSSALEQATSSYPDSSGAVRRPDGGGRPWLAAASFPAAVLPPDALPLGTTNHSVK